MGLYRARAFGGRVWGLVLLFCWFRPHVWTGLWGTYCMSGSEGVGECRVGYVRWLENSINSP